MCLSARDEAALADRRSEFIFRIAAPSTILESGSSGSGPERQTVADLVAVSIIGGGGSSID